MYEILTKLFNTKICGSRLANGNQFYGCLRAGYITEQEFEQLMEIIPYEERGWHHKKRK